MRIWRILRVLLIAVLALLPANISPGAAEKINNQRISLSSPSPTAINTRILWDQIYPTPSDYSSQDFETIYDNYDIYAADNFVNDTTWYIYIITTIGGWGVAPVDLTEASELHWFIYPDSGSGEPAGHPGDGHELWGAHLPPTDSRVILGLSNPKAVDLVIANPVELPSGEWWLIFYPSLSLNPYGNYGWTGTLNPVWPPVGLQINPGSGFGNGTDWYENDHGSDYSFRMETYNYPVCLPVVQN